MPSKMHLAGVKQVGYFLGLAVILIASIWVQKDGGIDHPEHDVTIPHYLSDKTLVEKIFDIRYTEAPSSENNFQARELSYVFDALDVNFMWLSAQLGVAHYLSLTKVLFTIAILVIFWFHQRNHLALGANFSWLSLAVLLTCPGFFLGGYYHHNSKIGVGLGIGVLYCYLFSILRSKQPVFKKQWYLVALAGIIVCLFDVQGAFFVGIGLVCLMVHWLWNKDRRCASIASALGVAIIFYIEYRMHLGVKLIYWIHGYVASSGNQQIDFQSFLPGFGRSFFNSLSLMGIYFRNLMGTFEELSAIMFGLAVSILAIMYGVVRKAERYSRVYPIYLGFVVIATAVMLTLSQYRFPVLFNGESQRVYYVLPCTVLIWLSLVQFSADLYHLPWLRLGLGCLWFFIFCANVWYLPFHKSELDKTSLGSRPRGEYIVRLLRNPEDLSAKTTHTFPHRQIYESLRAN